MHECCFSAADSGPDISDTHVTTHPETRVAVSARRGCDEWRVHSIAFKRLMQKQASPGELQTMLARQRQAQRAQVALGSSHVTKVRPGRAWSSLEGRRQPPMRRLSQGMPGTRMSQPKQEPRYTSLLASGAISFEQSCAAPPSSQAVVGWGPARPPFPGRRRSDTALFFARNSATKPILVTMFHQKQLCTWLPELLTSHIRS